MTIIVGITHITHYKYDRPVSLSPQTIRLRPSPHNRVPIKSYSFKIKPKDHFINWYQDIFGNHVANVVINEKTTEFRIEIDLKAEIKTSNPFDFFIHKNYENWPFEYDLTNKIELGNYLNIIENGPLLNKWIAKNVDRKKNHKTLDFLVDINKKLNESLGYIIRMEQGVYTPEDLFKIGKGSCRDFAWTLCNIYRHLGFAARFVSGYLVQLKGDIKPLVGPAGVKEDIVDLHAWCEVYLPGAGWIGFDATSGLLCGEGHIPLSASPLPFQAAPVDGLLDKCESALDHSMSVVRLVEPPRVTKPFSESQWNDIDRLAEKIDKEIKNSKINLTVGGEPTFISTENRDAAEWNTEALGEEKWQKSVLLMYKMKERFAPQGILHFGQGKWYSGEVLPRWSLGCFTRKDGEAIWKNEGLIANITKKNKIKPEIAKDFIKALCKALALPEKNILTAKDGTKTKAFVVPIIYSIKRKGWITNNWKFEKGINLITGDSAAGYRLPLNLVPYIAEGDKEIPLLRSNFEKLGSLAKYKDIKNKINKNLKSKPATDYLKKDKFGYVRTALCTEVRDGILKIFLPPISYIEHYLELITAIETVSEKLKIPVQIEGYEPPKDLRLDYFHITPDPGVIEVNVRPSKNWKELKDVYETLFDAAFRTKLTAEKFMIDGRRVGTGGGNHIVLGGPLPDKSPFLNRPDLLKSIILYWQNHPGLSYLFSTIFIGPTSQAPRIDEARSDSLYELEIALKQINKNKQTAPWLLDRLLRNILVDITGNTHRTEICIDKLYSPDGERGRLGLVEFRGFEMTPHSRMNLLQMLLLRALVAMFWNKPYEAKTIAWNNQLHDKFMLPHFVWNDFRKVLNDLNNYGFKFKQEWFLPQFNFRFPLYGIQKIDDVEIELRMALEPWPVLGEEAVLGGTSRGVDAALERLQIKVKGLNENKHRITCNKYLVELHDTDEPDVKIAGVKFKAWNPPKTLHPNLPVNSPLTFDVYDLENKCSVGGCKYHVFHPGGRNYETTPINVNEAEGRMISRFEKIGHTSGKFKIKTVDYHPEFPFTLDLRRK